jgi:hypothetical protein
MDKLTLNHCWLLLGLPQGACGFLSDLLGIVPAEHPCHPRLHILEELLEGLLSTCIHTF